MKVEFGLMLIDYGTSLPNAGEKWQLLTWGHFDVETEICRLKNLYQEKCAMVHDKYKLATWYVPKLMSLFATY